MSQSAQVPQVVRIIGYIQLLAGLVTALFTLFSLPQLFMGPVVILAGIQEGGLAAVGLGFVGLAVMIQPLIIGVGAAACLFTAFEHIAGEPRAFRRPALAAELGSILGFGIFSAGAGAVCWVLAQQPEAKAWYRRP